MMQSPWDRAQPDEWLPRSLRLCWGSGDSGSSDGGATTGGGDWGSSGSYDAGAFNAGGDLSAWSGTAYDASTFGTGAGGGGDWGSFGDTSYGGFNAPNAIYTDVAGPNPGVTTGGGDWGSAGTFSAAGTGGGPGGAMFGADLGAGAGAPGQLASGGFWGDYAGGGFNQGGGGGFFGDQGGPSGYTGSGGGPQGGGPTGPAASPSASFSGFGHASGGPTGSSSSGHAGGHVSGGPTGSTSGGPAVTAGGVANPVSAAPDADADPDAGPAAAPAADPDAGGKGADPDAAPLGTPAPAQSEARPEAEAGPSLSDGAPAGMISGDQDASPAAAAARAESEPSAPSTSAFGPQSVAGQQALQTLSDLTQSALQPGPADYQGSPYADMGPQQAGPQAAPQQDSFDSRFGDWGQQPAAPSQAYQDTMQALSNLTQTALDPPSQAYQGIEPGAAQYAFEPAGPAPAPEPAEPFGDLITAPINPIMYPFTQLLDYLMDLPNPLPPGTIDPITAWSNFAQNTLLGGSNIQPLGPDAFNAFEAGQQGKAGANPDTTPWGSVFEGAAPAPEGIEPGAEQYGFPEAQPAIEAFIPGGRETDWAYGPEADLMNTPFMEAIAPTETPTAPPPLTPDEMARAIDVDIRPAIDPSTVGRLQDAGEPQPAEASPATPGSQPIISPPATLPPAVEAPESGRPAETAPSRPGETPASRPAEQPQAPPQTPQAPPSLVDMARPGVPTPQVQPTETPQTRPAPQPGLVDMQPPSAPTPQVRPTETPQVAPQPQPAEPDDDHNAPEPGDRSQPPQDPNAPRPPGNIPGQPIGARGIYTNDRMDNRQTNSNYRDSGRTDYPQGRPGIDFRTARQAGIEPVFRTEDINVQDTDARLIENINRALRDMERTTGIPANSLVATSGWRPAHRGEAYEHGMDPRTSQESVYTRYNPNGRNIGPAALPGGSNHAPGRALDFAASRARDWLRAHAREYGLETLGTRRGVPFDEPHIQLPRGQGGGARPSAQEQADQRAIDAQNRQAAIDRGLIAPGRGQAPAQQAGVPTPRARPSDAPQPEVAQPDVTPRPPADIPTALPSPTMPLPQETRPPADIPSLVPPRATGPNEYDIPVSPARAGRLDIGVVNNALQRATAHLNKNSGEAEFAAASVVAAKDLARAGVPLAVARSEMQKGAYAGAAKNGYDINSWPMGGVYKSKIDGGIEAALQGYQPAKPGEVQGPPSPAPAPAPAAAAPGKQGSLLDFLQNFNPISTAEARSSGRSQPGQLRAPQADPGTIQSRLSEQRSNVINDLQTNQGLRNTLDLIVTGEVGSQGKAAVLGFLETAMNKVAAEASREGRAATGRDLLQYLNDRSYFPDTWGKIESGKIKGGALTDDLLAAVGGGSNTTGLSTGNSSATSQGSRFGGNPTNATIGKEHYGVENYGHHNAWYNAMGAPAPGRGIGSDYAVGPQDMPAAVAAPAPTMPLRGLAKGGHVAKDERVVVGEEGPEYFVPDQPGTVWPHMPQPGKGKNVDRWPKLPAAEYPGRFGGVEREIERQTRNAQNPSPSLMDMVDSGQLRLTPNWQRMINDPGLIALGRSRMDDRREGIDPSAEQYGVFMPAPAPAAEPPDPENPMAQALGYGAIRRPAVRIGRQSYQDRR